jgi:CRISPR-associated protein Cas5d
VTINSRNKIRLRVWGDYACFTRPEMKVERVSYEAMTPSAARNILQAILWKPAMEWRVTQIDVLQPIRWISIRRNELSSVIAAGTVNQAMKSDSMDIGVFIEDDRQQRAGLFLRDVEYVIHADFSMTARAGQSDNENKFREIFLRRAGKGQCFMQPYLGCREFAAFFELLEADAPDPKPIEETKALGWMLYDLDYKQSSPTPAFFNAQIEHGSLKVPDPASMEVRQ